MINTDLCYLLSRVGHALHGRDHTLTGVTVRWHDGDGYSVDSDAQEYLTLPEPKHPRDVTVTVLEPDGYERGGVDAYDVLRGLRAADVAGCDDEHLIAVDLSSRRAMVLQPGQHCPLDYRRLDSLSRRDLALRLIGG
jgi:hypothetical protein